MFDALRGMVVVSQGKDMTSMDELIGILYYVWWIYVCRCVSSSGNYGPKGENYFYFSMSDALMDVGVSSSTEGKYPLSITTK